MHGQQNIKNWFKHVHGHQAYRRHNTSGASSLSPQQHQWRIKLIAVTTPVAHQAIAATTPVAQETYRR